MIVDTLFLYEKNNVQIRLEELVPLKMINSRHIELDF